MSAIAREELCFMSAVEAAERIRARELSPVELVEAILERAASEPAAELNAFTVLLEEAARDDAAAAERALAGDEPLGPLHGVPFTIKDLTPTAGIETAYGSTAYAGNVPGEDAPIVSRMREAGGILLGKTTTPEFGNKGVTQSPLTGTTRNPWRPTHIAGGSSGGAAAAVAAGLGPLAQGSDGGGSIRIPAACCGVVGLKPSFGRVPFLPEDSVFETLTHIGPIARSVGDAALMLDAVAGPHEADPFSLPAAEGSFLAAARGGSCAGLRVAYSPDLGIGPVEPDVAAAVSTAAAVFSGPLGAAVTEIEAGLPDPQEAMLTMWSTTLGYIAEDLLLPRTAEARIDPAVLELHRAAGALSAIDYYRAAVVFRDELYRAVAALFGEYDLLITPTTATAAFPHPGWQPGPGLIDGQAVERRIGWIFTYPFNMTGHPAISVPCGFSEEGMPVGLQIVGPRHGDAAVLAAAAAYEAAAGWAGLRPGLTEAGP